MESIVRERSMAQSTKSQSSSCKEPTVLANSAAPRAETALPKRRLERKEVPVRMAEETPMREREAPWMSGKAFRPLAEMELSAKRQDEAEKEAVSETERAPRQKRATRVLVTETAEKTESETSTERNPERETAPGRERETKAVENEELRMEKMEAPAAVA